MWQMMLLNCLALGLSIASPAWAVDAAAQPAHDPEGWAVSNGEIARDQQGESFVRLALKANRGLSDLSFTAPLQAGRDYELRLEYASSNPVSARDLGSWLYLAFRDGQNKNVSESCQTLDQVAAWKSRSIRFTAPRGAAKVYMSFRQQQRAGALDIKAVELILSGSEAKVTLSLAAKAALAWIMMPGEKLTPEGERSPRDGNIFLPYLKGKPPPIVHELASTQVGDVQVRRVVFRSMTVGGESQDVYAIIARPSREGRLPGLLWLHGGSGCTRKHRRFASPRPDTWRSPPTSRESPIRKNAPTRSVLGQSDGGNWAGRRSRIQLPTRHLMRSSPRSRLSISSSHSLASSRTGSA